MRYLTAGESHGPALTAIIEGFPAGLELDVELINRELARRQSGYGRGARMKIESDRVEVLSGLRFGRTLGSPLTLQIKNRDFANWETRMAPTGDPPPDLERLTRPRPGHADLPGALKYGLLDLRDVLERASARETAARTAVGAVARQLLAVFSIEIFSYVEAIGPVKAQATGMSPEELKKSAESSPLRCPDPSAEARMIAEIDQARAKGDSLGGVFTVIATGVPPGLGSHVQWDRRLDARLAAALMSIQAIKGVEVGEGFSAAEKPGSLVQDEICHTPGRGYFHTTNRAGGIEGGMTNGEPLILRAAMKPIPTLMKPLTSVDMRDHTAVAAGVERSDVCAVPAAAVVGEAVTAWELACALAEKLGADSVDEMYGHYREYMNIVKER